MKRPGRQITWDQTLATYLQRSNEDESVLAAFGERVLPLLSGQRITWTEIGCGPGTKTLGIADALAREAVCVPSLTIVEKSAQWQSELREKEVLERLAKTLRTQVRLLGIPLEACDPADLLFNERSRSLITCVHVLYEAAVLRGFQRLVEAASAEGGQSVVFFVVLESRNSDFRKLRDSLAEVGFDVPSCLLSETNEIFCANRAVILRRHETVGKLCRLEGSRDYEWLVPFLLGLAPDAFRLVDELRRNLAFHVVDRFVSESSILCVPDEVIVAQI